MKTQLAGVAYALVAVLTYGHAFVAWEAAATAECRKNDASFCHVSDQALMVATGSAALWPLYVSVQAFRRLGVA
jgi:hypothetical protein